VTVDIGAAPPQPPPPTAAKQPMGATISGFKRSTRAITFKVTCNPAGTLEACRGRLRVVLAKPIGTVRRLGAVQLDIRRGTTRTMRLGLSRSQRKKTAGRAVRLRIAGWVRQADKARPIPVTAVTTTLKAPSR
jgi:hypothetical protein